MYSKPPTGTDFRLNVTLDWKARAEAAEARVKVLEEALVEAAIPLEAMRIANVTQTLCAEMREGIETAVKCIRAALGGEHVG